jgi:hypothetical protein
MAAEIRRAEYFYLMVRDRPGEAYTLLSRLASAGVDLLAFSAIPMGGETTQLVLYPAEATKLLAAAEQAGLVLTGPQRAFLITGDDQLGAIAEIHGTLAREKINVFASSGVTDGRGGFGYLLHVRPEDFERAAQTLER